jgi:hypothetical protein
MDVFVEAYRDVFTAVLETSFRPRLRSPPPYNPIPDNNESTSPCPFTTFP